jgi:RNA polymerase sigma factor (sigma-70 family)
MDASTTESAAGDAWLIEASRRGERAAFGQLVERYQRAVTAVSLSATGSSALSDDVAQDTFVTAWHRLGSLRDPSRLGPWLCGIARHLGRKARRRRARELPLDASTEDPPADGDPFAEVSAAEAEATVRRALGQVPEAFREVLVLYYQDGQSARHVAQVLGLSEAAVMQRLSRGRALLARGVDELVARSLRAGPRSTASSLRARVLAALPVVPASHVATPLAGACAGQRIDLDAQARTRHRPRRRRRHHPLCRAARSGTTSRCATRRAGRAGEHRADRAARADAA